MEFASLLRDAALNENREAWTAHLTAATIRTCEEMGWQAAAKRTAAPVSSRGTQRVPYHRRDGILATIQLDTLAASNSRIRAGEQQESGSYSLFVLEAPVLARAVACSLLLSPWVIRWSDHCPLLASRGPQGAGYAPRRRDCGSCRQPRRVFNVSLWILSLVAPQSEHHKL